VGPTVLFSKIWDTGSKLAFAPNPKFFPVKREIQHDISQYKLSEGKILSKAYSISYCFSKREGGVLLTADLRTSCHFDTFLKKYFHIRFESDVSSFTSASASILVQPTNIKRTQYTALHSLLRMSK
jgi:hypothetical protein